MTTHAIIARQKGDGFVGRYHHYDGYPTWLGRALWQSYQQRFGRDLDAMLAFLLDTHRSGWSQIADPDADPTNVHNQDACYCHGGGHLDKRSEPELTATEKVDLDQAWVYVFAPNVLSVLRCIGLDEEGHPRYSLSATVALDGPEPDWQRIEDTV